MSLPRDTTPAAPPPTPRPAAPDAFDEDLDDLDTRPVSRPRVPTRHKPGTEGKIQVLARRAAMRQELFHPLDAPLSERDAYSAEMAGGDNAFALALLRQNERGELETVEVKPERTRRHRTAQEKAQAFLNRERERLRKRLERSARREAREAGEGREGREGRAA